MFWNLKTRLLKTQFDYIFAYLGVPFRLERSLKSMIPLGLLQTQLSEFPSTSGHNFAVCFPSEQLSRTRTTTTAAPNLIASCFQSCQASQNWVSIGSVHWVPQYRSFGHVHLTTPVWRQGLVQLCLLQMFHCDAVCTVGAGGVRQACCSSMCSVQDWDKWW